MIRIQGLLIVLGGLPGVGKTSIAKEICNRLSAAHLRIDTIEQALLRHCARASGEEGYLVAFEIARDNLLLGNTVVADAVNSTAITRVAWREVAQAANANVFEIEFICSNKAEHRRRIEERVPDILGHNLPTWADVTGHSYEVWTTKNLSIDTAQQTTIGAAEFCINSMEHQNLIFMR